MKTKYVIWSALAAAAVLIPAAVRAEDTATNRLTFSARFGFNISAKFKGFGPGAPVPPAARRTPPDPGNPNGHPYNFDDGYVYPDDGAIYDPTHTAYWGYDSASQISGGTILLSSSTSVGAASSESLESEPYLGAELAYNRELGRHGNLHFGLELAANYLNFDVQDNRSYWSRTTAAYPFTGVEPPISPYEGPYAGGAFFLDTSHPSTTTTTVGGRRFDSDIWGFRLGPYLETPLCQRLNLSASAGLAVGLLDSTVSWDQTVTIIDGGSTSSTSSRTCASRFDAVWGYYVRANVSWQLSGRWSAVGGVQFQDLGTYQRSFAGQEVELNLRNSLFLTAGLSYCF